MTGNNINLNNREHNWKGRVITRHLQLISGTNEYYLRDVFPDNFSKADAYGIAFRRQSVQSLGGSPTLTKAACTKKWGFRDICNLNAFVTGELSVRDASGNELMNFGLEYASFDTFSHEPGKYMQLILVDGFDREKSYIKLDGAKITTDEVIEIVLLPLLDVACKPMRSC